MAFLDELFGNVSADPAGYGGPQDGMMSKFESLFKDQNFVRGLGEAGKAVSAGGNAGEVLGDFNTNLIRRRQAQKVAQETRKAGQTFQERLLDAVRGGTLLSSTEDNEAFDSFSLDGDGNVSLSMKNTPQKIGYKKNQPLEAMRRPSTGGSDLPDFSEQSSGGNIDFAGLDPEDISMLLKAEQQFGELSQRDAQIILQEKSKREDSIRDSQDRAAQLKALVEERRQARTDKQAEAEAKVLADKTLQDRYDAREFLKERLQSNLTPEERTKANLELRKLSQEVKNLEAGKGNPSDLIAQRRLEIAERGEQREIAESEIATQDFILNPETPRTQAILQANKENANPDGEYVFYNAVDAPWFGSNTDIMDAWKIPDDLVFEGQPVTPPRLVEIAKQKGVTIQELIKALEGQ